MFDEFSWSLLRFDWRDVLDILLVTFLFYQIFQIVRGSRALAMLLGFSLLIAAYFIARLVGVYTFAWLLQHFFSYLFLVLVIIFQKDIRQVLSDVGERGLWRRKKHHDKSVEDVITACIEMAHKRMGALIVFERTIPLQNFITGGSVRIDAEISPQLLLNIFYPKAPLHDGAVIVSHGKLMAAACILPLAERPEKSFGTRHRAALGVTQESDALAIVVSEERGEISVAWKNELTRNLDATKLRQVLQNVT